MKVTTDTITDAQIRELRASKPPKPLTRRNLWSLCDRAIRDDGPYDRACRSRCAEILNTRNDGGKT